MNKLFFIAIICCFVAGCGNEHKQIPAEVNTTINADTTDTAFFPVTAFLKGQMTELDSLPVTPLFITTAQKKTDSAWLKKEAVRPLLQPFISAEINENNLTHFFKATKFNDQSVNAITFTYDPKIALPDSILIRHWDIYINPETGKINKAYIVKLLYEHDKTYTQQLIWQTNKWAKITTFINKPDGNIEIVKEEKLIWDLTE